VARYSDERKEAVLRSSRPGVSDHNAFAETLFRTLKYRPAYPANGFADLRAAREWVLDFVSTL